MWDMPETVVIIANGDLRLSANQKCWPAQAQAEESVMKAIRREGRDVRRGHACDAEKGHGFIDSQKHGMEVFRSLPPDAPLVVVEAVWQYSHHILHGLYSHKGPILTVANWSGQWPGRDQKEAPRFRSRPIDAALRNCSAAKDRKSVV